MAGAAVVTENGRLVSPTELARRAAADEEARAADTAAAAPTPPRNGTQRATVDTPITASAERVDLSDEAQVKRIAKQSQRWQTQAWELSDALGILKFVENIIGNSMSRLRLAPAVLNPEDPEGPPIPMGEAVEDTTVNEDGTANPDGRLPLVPEALAVDARDDTARIRDRDGGQGQIMADLGKCLTIPGEGYLVGREDGEGETVEVWAEIVDSGGKARLRAYPGDPGVELPEGVVPWRVWRRHARWRGLADSNMRGVIDDCMNLLVLKRKMRANLNRGLQAGALLLPSEATFGGTHVATESGVNAAPDSFDSILMAAMTAPIGDADSVSSVVPAIARMRGENIKEIRHLELAFPIGQAELQLAKDLAVSIAQGLDLPNESILGIADASHWTAWQVDEDKYRQHIEPLAKLIADSLAGWVRASLLARIGESATPVGYSAADVARVVLVVDATDLIQDPDRSEAAKSAHEMLLISDEAARRDLGYGEEDAPSEEEYARRLAAKQAPGFPPSGGGDPAPEQEPAEVDDPEPVEAVVAAGRRNLGQRLAAIDRSLSDRVLTACDAALERALERAGASLRSRAGNDKATKATLDGVANALVAAHLGPTRVQALVAAGDPLEGAFDGLALRFRRMTEQAQASARAVLADVGMDGDDLAELEAEQAEDRDDATGWLVGALMGLARQRLFDPSPAAPGLGELDVTVNVPPSMVRSSLARAGGASPSETAVGGVVAASGDPVGGVVTGDVVRRAFASVALPWTGYVWVYGSFGASSRPFQGHEDLDGVSFTDWADPVLTVRDEDSWLGRDVYSPGDHRGCSCSWEPSIPDRTLTTEED